MIVGQGIPGHWPSAPGLVVSFLIFFLSLRIWDGVSDILKILSGWHVCIPLSSYSEAPIYGSA